MGNPKSPKECLQLLQFENSFQSKLEEDRLQTVDRNVDQPIGQVATPTLAAVEVCYGNEETGNLALVSYQ